MTPLDTRAPTRQSLTIRYWVPEPISNGPHGHWATHRRKLKDAKIMGWACAKYAGWQRVDTKVRLTITFVFSVNRTRDTDNLYSRATGLVNGLKEWFVDDSTEWLELVVRAEVVPGQKCTKIELEGLV